MGFGSGAEAVRKLVLDAVSSPLTCIMYARALGDFFTWFRYRRRLICAIISAAWLVRSSWTRAATCAFLRKREAETAALLGRYVTVVRNGVTIIDNQEIPGINGGALDSREADPGPFNIQGSHSGGIKYRNIAVSVPKR
jgi:hypothetical protein